MGIAVAGKPVRFRSIAIGGLLLAGAAIAAATGTAAQEAAVKGRCVTSATKFMTSATAHFTAPAQFTTVPDTQVAFRQKPSRSCVIVRFSADVFAQSNRVMLIRAVLDGTTFAEPGTVTFTAGTPSVSEARSFEFVFPNVARGKHEIYLEWRSLSGDDILLGSRTVTVAYGN